ncbi:MAG TPA: response regulator [Clostridiaceae bacterium]|nr:response regulator [Clostridiaceae bacterium]
MQCTILTVDELEIVRSELVEILKDQNVEIINAVNEAEALKIIGKDGHSIDIIIWAVNTADLKSFEALKRVKGNHLCKDIPIIVVSSLTDKKYVIKAIESGAVEYIAKPYDENAVVKKISRVAGFLNKLYNFEITEDIITFSFSEMSNREIKAASRGGYPLTFMLVSVIPNDDLIKSEYQKEISSLTSIINRVIRSNLRETDTSFHNGVNKLMLLLPFADSKGAKVIEKRIYELFENHTIIRKKNNGHKLFITSVSYPEDGKVKDKLLQKLEENYNNFLRSKGA